LRARQPADDKAAGRASDGGDKRRGVRLLGPDDQDVLQSLLQGDMTNCEVSFSQWHVRLAMCSPYIEFRKHGDSITACPHFEKLQRLFSYLQAPETYVDSIELRLDKAKGYLANYGQSKNSEDAQKAYDALRVAWQFLMHDPLCDPRFALPGADGQGFDKIKGLDQSDTLREVLYDDENPDGFLSVATKVTDGLRSIAERLRSNLYGDNHRLRLPDHLQLRGDSSPWILNFRQEWLNGDARITFGFPEPNDGDLPALCPLVFNALVTEYRTFVSVGEELEPLQTGDKLFFLPYCITGTNMMRNRQAVYYIGFAPLWFSDPNSTGEGNGLAILNESQLKQFVASYLQPSGLIVRRLARIDLDSLNVYATGDFKGEPTVRLVSGPAAGSAPDPAPLLKIAPAGEDRHDDRVALLDPQAPGTESIALPRWLEEMKVLALSPVWESDFVNYGVYMTLKKQGDLITVCPAFDRVYELLHYLQGPSDFVKDNLGRHVGEARQNLEKLQEDLTENVLPAAVKESIETDVCNCLREAWCAATYDPLCDPRYSAAVGLKMKDAADDEYVWGVYEEDSPTVDELMDIKNQTAGASRDEAFCETAEDICKRMEGLLRRITDRFYDREGRDNLVRWRQLQRTSAGDLWHDRFVDAWNSNNVRILFLPPGSDKARDAKAKGKAGKSGKHKQPELCPSVFNALANEYRLFTSGQCAELRTEDQALVFLPYYVVEADLSTVFYVGYLPLRLRGGSAVFLHHHTILNEPELMDFLTGRLKPRGVPRRLPRIDLKLLHVYAAGLYKDQPPIELA